jgi:hypothetical protein
MQTNMAKVNTWYLAHGPHSFLFPSGLVEHHHNDADDLFAIKKVSSRKGKSPQDTPSGNWRQPDYITQVISLTGHFYLTGIAIWASQ